MPCRADHVIMKIVDTLKRKKKKLFSPVVDQKWCITLALSIQHINVMTVFYFIFYSYNLKWLFPRLYSAV